LRALPLPQAGEGAQPLSFAPLVERLGLHDRSAVVAADGPVSLAGSNRWNLRLSNSRPPPLSARKRHTRCSKLRATSQQIREDLPGPTGVMSCAWLRKREFMHCFRTDRGNLLSSLRRKGRGETKPATGR